MDQRFGAAHIAQLTDRHGQADTVVTPVLDTAIADADALIDRYLVDGGYELPLSTVPAVLVRVACLITYRNLHTAIITDRARQGFEEAESLLEKIQSGELTIGIDRETISGIAAPTRTFQIDWDDYDEIPVQSGTYADGWTRSS